MGEYEQWKAALHAGATLGDLYRWWNTDLDDSFMPAFKAKVVAFYRIDSAVEAHNVEDNKPRTKRR